MTDEERDQFTLAQLSFTATKLKEALSSKLDISDDQYDYLKLTFEASLEMLDARLDGAGPDAADLYHRYGPDALCPEICSRAKT